jgi:hypothetical protein
MKARPYSVEDVVSIDRAIFHLTIAVAHLKKARCPLTLKKVRSAIKSAEGARNNAHARQFRDNRRFCLGTDLIRE